MTPAIPISQGLSGALPPLRYASDSFRPNIPWLILTAPHRLSVTTGAVATHFRWFKVGYPDTQLADGGIYSAHKPIRW